MQTYLSEAENLRLIDAIGADLYQWLDETDFSGDGPFEYTPPGATTVSITKEQYTALMDGGYFTDSCGCQGKRKSAGLIAAIAYIAYARFIVNNPINATAFGVLYKDGEFSSRVEDTVLVRNSSEARKIGEAYLANVIEHLGTLGLIHCKTYVEAPRGIYRVGREKL